MPRTLTAWVRPTVLRNVPSADSIQIAIWARSVGVKVRTIARSPAACDATAHPRIAVAKSKLGSRDIRGRIIARNQLPPGSQILEMTRVGSRRALLAAYHRGRVRVPSGTSQRSCDAGRSRFIPFEGSRDNAMVAA